MFHHIVQLGFEQGLTQADQAFIARQCDLLQRAIPGLTDMRFVANASNRTPEYSHAFVATFSDPQAHDLYQAAPEHDALRQFVAQHQARMVVLDFTD